ncbi:MAG TPA: CapA family protein [Bryobacteraceae bacterium]|nr:CapA family protein [Bryobacteraceae bacterium]
MVIPMTRRHAMALLAAVNRPPETRILLGGDVMLTRGVAQVAQAHQDPAYPFREIAALFSGADIAFGNLESPFVEDGRPARGSMVFRAAKEMIAGLEAAGIDVVSTANNHSRDAGPRGLEYTVSLLRQRGIAVAGTGLSFAEAHAGVILVRNNVRFGFLAYTFDANNGNYTDTEPRVAVTDIPQMRIDVMSLRQRADVVLVSMHAGWEYHKAPNPQQKEFAKAAIDAGASVVVGHHPHVVQPWERYGNGAIFYSLGNLVFDQSTPKETTQGQIAEVVFRGTTLLSAGVIPVEIAGSVPRRVSL